MAGGAWRRGAARARTLRTLLRDTARALQDVQDILPVDPEVLSVVQEITNDTARPTALVILGTSPSARARLLNCLLGKKLLPESLPRGSKWLRIQYGASTQVHLTVGNSEFELVEELECNQKPWDTLPLQDLLRQSHTDLGTTLEVELNTSLLKDGLRIIVPPDMNTDPGSSDYTTLKQIHNDLYHKRAAILKTYTPIFVYALDKFGRNIFNDNVSKMCVSRGEDDFWSTFNQNYMTKDSNGEKGQETTQQVLEEMWTESSSVFNFENFLDLHQIKEIDSNAQVFFCLFSNSRAEEKRRNPLSDATESTESALYNTEELPESDQGIFKDEEFRQTEQSPHSSKPNRRLQEEQIAFMNELLDQWELISHPPQKHNVKSQWAILDDVEIFKNLDNSEAEHGKRKKEIDSDRTQKTRGSLLNHVMRFAAESSQACLLHQCTRLSEVHGSVLQRCVLASFELARELQVVPAKVQFVARHEQQLYETIYEKFSEGDKKQELLQIMQEVLQEMRSEINNMDWSVDDLPCHQDKRYAMSNSIFYSSRSSPSISLQLSNPDRIGNGADRPERVDSPEPEDESDVEEAVSYESYNFDDFEVIHSNDESLCMSDVFGRQRSKPDSPTSLVTPIPIENEMELYSLSNAWRSVSVTTHSSVCTSSNISSKQASLDVQRTVLSKLSRKISLKMVKFVDCLKDSYFGTLQRCLGSLEAGCRREGGARPASEAMRQLLSAARRVDLTPAASFSALRGLALALRRLLHRLRIAGGEEESACCVLSPAWRRSAALQTAQELTPQRLARLISVQILERLSEAHERYQSALTSLESALASRLHHTEDIKLAIRKKYAPSFAQLCLESTSMCDLLMYGAPELGREIGRGQYGVVYAVRGAWAGHNPACVKSVFPADDRHYRELAMEFYYTRSIPAHPRVVRLLGALVARGGGAAPGVRLVSPRYCRDLHAAVRAGLAFRARMRIACDVVEGIRYLHSLGLVHRDVKLKNVLLDEASRAALADLGFCAAEALMSGSVVGTPVHMAPELLGGRYHAAVDVYAFGILFWYLCAGNIKLPSAFETFQNKEQLWSKVKRGLRPERLPSFSDECWEIMESCWASEPSERALLGDVQNKIEAILQKALEEDQGPVNYGNNRENYNSDDSLDMTGLHRDTRDNLC